MPYVNSLPYWKVREAMSNTDTQKQLPAAQVTTFVSELIGRVPSAQRLNVVATAFESLSKIDPAAHQKAMASMATNLINDLMRTASPAQKQAVIEAGAKVLPAVTGKKAAPSVS